MSTTADRIQELRKQKGVKRSDVALATGLSVYAIKSYELGQREPNSKAMAVLERYFDVSGEYLRGETDEPHPGGWYDPGVTRISPSNYEDLFHKISERLQSSTPKVQHFYEDVLMELWMSLKNTDEVVQEAAAEYFFITVVYGGLFIRSCAESDLSDFEFDISRARGSLLVQISDELLAVQKHVTQTNPTSKDASHNLFPRILE